MSAGTPGLKGADGTSTNSGSVKPGYGGGAGGVSVEMVLSNSTGSGYYPADTSVISSPPDVSSLTSQDGSAGGGTSETGNSSSNASGGQGGTAGTGWGAGGGGGGGAAQATNNNYPVASKGLGGMPSMK